MSVLRSAVHQALKCHLDFLAGLMASAAASIRSRELVRISRYGASWKHEYGGEVVVLSDWWSTPRAHVRSHYETFFWQYKPKQDDICLDIGAGSGTEVIELSRLVGPGGLVVAIEPNPFVFERLLITIRKNRLTNCLPLNIAISDEKGLSAIAADETSDSEAVGGRLSSSGRVKVITMTLDDLLENLASKRVDYVKMNIEGLEGRVISKASLAFSRVTNWCISCHNFLEGDEYQTFDEVVDTLKTNGINPISNPSAGSGSAHFYVYAKRSSSETDVDREFLSTMNP